MNRAMYRLSALIVTVYPSLVRSFLYIPHPKAYRRFFTNLLLKKHLRAKLCVKLRIKYTILLSKLNLKHETNHHPS
jgi:hypothetical protein